MRQQVKDWIAEASEDGCFFDEDEIPWGPFFWNLYERRSGDGWRWRALSGYEIHLKASDFRTWAHLMVHLKAAGSASEARRRGFTGAVVPCERVITVRGCRRFLVVV